MSGKYLIWSNEHKAWWRANALGYTTVLSNAGRYTREEAIKHSRSRDEGYPPPELAIPEIDALACLLDDLPEDITTDIEDRLRQTGYLPICTEAADVIRDLRAALHMLQQQQQFIALRVANQKRDKLWDPNDKIDPLFRSTEFAGEAGEICNIVKKLVREQRGIKGSRTTLSRLAGEIGDGIIALDLLAMEYNLDTWACVREKFNETSNDEGFDVFI